MFDLNRYCSILRLRNKFYIGLRHNGIIRWAVKITNGNNSSSLSGKVWRQAGFKGIPEGADRDIRAPGTYYFSAEKDAVNIAEKWVKALQAKGIVE